MTDIEFLYWLTIDNKSTFSKRIEFTLTLTADLFILCLCASYNEQTKLPVIGVSPRSVKRTDYENLFLFTAETIIAKRLVCFPYTSIKSAARWTDIE